MEPSAPRARPLARALACGYCAYHLAAVSLANVPQTTAMGTAFHRPFLTYLNVFALHQTWDMFTTIPHFLAMKGELTLSDGAGHEIRKGPLLPGLGRYVNENRLHVTFMRLAFNADAYPGFPQRYLAAVCNALAIDTGSRPKSVGFELRVMQLRPLADVRRDHRIGEPKNFSFGPAPCVP